MFLPPAVTMMSFLRSVIAVDRFPRGLGLVEVALHHVRPARKDLAVARDHDFDPAHGFPDRADAECSRGVHRYHGRRLGEPVAFEDDEAGRVEELVDLRGQRRAAGHEVAQPAAGARLEFREY
jgi:hypothetical protein